MSNDTLLRCCGCEAVVRKEQERFGVRFEGMKALTLAIGTMLMLVAFTGCHDDGYYGRSYHRSGYYGHDPYYRSRHLVTVRSTRSYPYSSRYYGRPYYYGSRPSYYGPRRRASVTFYP